MGPSEAHVQTTLGLKARSNKPAHPKITSTSLVSAAGESTYRACRMEATAMITAEKVNRAKEYPERFVRSENPKGEGWYTPSGIAVQSRYR
jgi:hypothetical protein